MCFPSVLRVVLKHLLREIKVGRGLAPAAEDERTPSGGTKAPPYDMYTDGVYYEN